MRGLALFPAALLTLVCAAAAVQAQGGFPAANGPVEIDARDGVEWVSAPDGASGYYRARGNVVVRQEGLTLQAGEVTAFYRRGAAQAQEIHRLEASGAVVMRNETTEASGDAAVYDLTAGTVLMTGRQVQLTGREMVITASRSMEFRDRENLVIARGGAVAAQGERRLRADRLTAYLTRAAADAPGRVERIDAAGDVHLSTPAEVIRAEEGVYNVTAEQALLCGSVRISRGSNQLNGECAEVDLKNGRSILKGRVNSLIVPRDAEN